MAHWEFALRTDQRWYWRRVNVDGTCRDSAHAFERRLDCVADAFDHGYLSPADDGYLVSSSSAQSSPGSTRWDER